MEGALNLNLNLSLRDCTNALASHGLNAWRSRALTHLRLCVMIACSTFGATTGQGHAREQVQLTFQSASYADFRQLQLREPAAATVTVSATLSFPENTRDRYPAVVVVHTIAGYLDANEGQYAAELRKAGFATLTYDSFAARKTTGLALSRSGPGLWPSGVADAYAALRLLAGHPRIDAGRVAIVGFSYGGEVAHLAAFERLRAALNPGEARFAAHVAYYSAGVFGVIAEPSAYTGSPVLMLLGEKDDNLPVTKIESYLAYAKGAGSRPDRPRNLSGRLPRVDGSQLDELALLSGVREHEKMSAHPAGIRAARVARRWPADAFRPRHLRRVHGAGAGLHHGF
jgi:dienelactone hydrolase